MHRSPGDMHQPPGAHLLLLSVDLDDPVSTLDDIDLCLVVAVRVGVFDREQVDRHCAADLCGKQLAKRKHFGDLFRQVFRVQCVH